MCLKNYIQSSIGRKQIVAVTGLSLILFVAGHLAGNLFFYGGPKAFNAYAQKLAHLRPGLYLVEIALAFVFLAHIYFTYTLVMENIQARPQHYYIQNPKGKRSLATRLMPFTGTILFAFVIWHLLDFTFIDHYGLKSFLADGKSYGLYGVVYNAFANVGHSLFYIVAMFCLGFHLYHGVDSVVQTFGWRDEAWVPVLRKVAFTLSAVVALGFSSIPVYVLLQ
ncbi:MAG: succinate dehydrogenase/fumarate reductase cytochrome b subunit [Candidatus Omnitrophica bacterium CG12_big_fil_rev_8_21_14_0_65_50_5]|nr:MAG: succinate dehydrogenase/fumarate reductase cytochrome b subunit [Candidatus Omnitrophica bacterium CG12_big_fil_rev_8_21_14_0_65_50_5]